MSNELKPCPCCGSDAERLETTRGYRVACENWDCDIGTLQCDWTERKAVEIWNTRVESSELSQLRKALKALVDSATVNEEQLNGLLMCNDYGESEALCKARQLLDKSKERMK